MSFELVSYHLSRTGTVTGYWIPVFLAISTGLGVVASLVLGRLYDRYELRVVLAAVFVSSPALAFLGGFFGALGGLVLWGIGYAMQDSLLKAVVAGLLPEGRRSLAFGLFYNRLRMRLVDRKRGNRAALRVFCSLAFSVSVQLASLLLFVLARRKSS
jgi:MFS family permease